MYNKATKYLFAGKYEKALQFFKKEPLEFKERFLNMGNCYRYLGDDKSAEKCYILANRADMPSANGVYEGMYPLALNNLGLLEYARGNDNLAISYYVSALEIDPLYYDALWNLGNAKLRKYFSTGDSTEWKEGWQLYDYRFKRSGNPVKIDTTFSTWDGVSTGDAIVVLTEQGLGDKIMFGRYIGLLKKYFDRVLVQCHPSLDCFYSDFEIVREVDPKMVSVPLCSLAGHFGLVSEDWLSGKFVAAEFPNGGVLGKPNIGVVWSGSSTHANDKNRSVPAHMFTEFSRFGQLYSLNPSAKVAKGMIDISSNDWSITASNILGLDIIVSVDTSIVHLAGTLGVPCLLLQPSKETDFRWGNNEVTTPWYKSVTIVTNPNNWDKTIQKTRVLLDTFVQEWRDKQIKEIIECTKK